MLEIIVNLSLRLVSLELYLGKIKGIKKNLCDFYFTILWVFFLLNFEIIIEKLKMAFVCYTANFVALFSFISEDTFRMCMPS